jgi:hypothetical protein
MPYSIEVDPDTEIIRVVLSGNVTMEDVRSVIANAWQLAAGQAAYRFLTEFHETRIKLSTLDLLTVHEHYETLGMSKNMRSALVVSGLPQLVEDVTIHELAANVGGWQVKVFSVRSDAIAWLLAENFCHGANS